jgi:Fic family protein
MFVNSSMGQLVPIHGVDPRQGEWDHVAFVPSPLPEDTPTLTATTFNEVANARAALATLDTAARQLPNPQLLRQPSLRREAQSTSALEGTYAPLRAVLAAAQDQPGSVALTEILNYVAAAEHAFSWQADGRPLTLGLLTDTQARLVRGTPADTAEAGQVRSIQVVIGNDPAAPVTAARFIPHPPGPALTTAVRDLLDWMSTTRSSGIDPVVEAALAHYQFETLHPFNDGNGRIGRLLIVLQLMQRGILGEPMMTVSPWFEVRRPEYYDRLMRVSTEGDWDGWVSFFARGIRASGEDARDQLARLVEVQDELKQLVRQSGLRADTAHSLVDFAVGNPSFTVNDVRDALGLSYARANKLIGQLIEIRVLDQVDSGTYNRRFFAPAVHDVLAMPTQ